jgi:hypothetical protein
MKKNKISTFIIHTFCAILIVFQTNTHTITNKQKWIGYGLGILFLYNAVTYGFQEESRKKDIETFGNDINICNAIKTKFSEIPDPENNEEAIGNFNNTMKKMIYQDYFDNLKYIFGGADKLVQHLNDRLEKNGKNITQAYCDFKNNSFPLNINEYIESIAENKINAKEHPVEYNFGKLKKDKWWIEQNVVLSCFIGIAYCLRRK